MRLTRTWIDSNLSRNERAALVEWLLERSQNPTGELIRQGLSELFPALEDLPSIQSCLSWRNAVWAFELHKRELADDSAAARVLADAGSGSDLDEANRVMLQSMIFSQLRSLKEGRTEDVNPEALAALAKNVSVLARQGMAERELRAKLAKLEREAEDAKRIVADTELSESERAAKMRGLFGMGS